MIGRVALLSMLGVLVAGTAFADAPGWCKGENNQRVVSGGSWERAAKDDPTDAVPAIVACLCEQECGSSSSDFAEHGAAVEQARRKWSQRLEMVDDDWSDAAEWATYGAAERQSYDLRNEKANLAWSSLDAVGQYMLINYQVGSNLSDPNYMADAFGARLSESGRVAYLHFCLGSNQKEVQWAMCQPDIAALDAHKVAAELHADKDHNGFQRFMIRLAMDRLRGKLTKHAVEVKAATDAAYGQMFTIASSTRKEWDGIWRSEAALVDLVLAMDDARVTNSRRAFAGCEDKTWSAFKAAVSSIPAKQFASIETDPLKWQGSPRQQAARIVVATPKGYLASAALYICHSGDQNKDPVIRALGGALLFWPGFRGPRDATQIAIASAGLQLDDRSAKIEYPSVHREWFGGDSGGSASGGGNGVVKAMKPEGELVHIEFATVKVSEPRCVQYKYTHRLTGIDSSGRFIYESGCAKEAMVSVDHTSSPVKVKKRYTEGVKPGMRIWATEDSVDVVWPKAGTRVPSIIAGAPVK